MEAASSESLAAVLQDLENAGLEPLRNAWRARYGPAPKLRSPELLRRLLAWRIQADELGGLDWEARRDLQRTQAPTKRQTLAPGTKLAREWQGRRYEVEVTDAGVTWEGRAYASLSEVARAITGVRWNGPRFFGLRDG